MDSVKIMITMSIILSVRVFFFFFLLLLLLPSLQLTDLFFSGVVVFSLDRQ